MNCFSFETGTFKRGSGVCRGSQRPSGVLSDEPHGSSLVRELHGLNSGHNTSLSDSLTEGKMEEIYHSHHIRVMTELNPDTDCWIPKAEVSWDEDGKQRHQVLTGPNDFFKIIDEAIQCAAEIAKDWIDSLARKNPTHKQLKY